jgi:hypothetical protein
VLVAGLDGEDDAALVDLDGLEAEQHADRGLRQLAGQDRSQRAQAVELRELARRLDRVVVDRRAGAQLLVAKRSCSVEARPRSHAASRSGAGSGFGFGFAGRGGSWAGVITASQGKSDSMVTSVPGMS